MTAATRRLRLAYIRAALATRETDCRGLALTYPPACPGWFEEDAGSPVRCDDCAHAIGLGDARLFDDDDAADLAARVRKGGAR